MISMNLQDNLQYNCIGKSNVSSLIITLTKIIFEIPASHN